MMSDVIIVGVLSLLGTLAGAWGGVRQANRLVEHRLKQLETKVDKHNRLVERMAVVEQRSKSNTHRLDELQDKID